MSVHWWVCSGECALVSYASKNNWHPLLAIFFSSSLFHSRCMCVILPQDNCCPCWVIIVHCDVKNWPLLPVECIHAPSQWFVLPASLTHTLIHDQSLLLSMWYNMNELQWRVKKKVAILIEQLFFSAPLNMRHVSDRERMRERERDEAQSHSE